MSQSSLGRVLVGTPEGRVVVRIEGRGTHMNSQPLHEFLSEAVRRGYIEFDIDLTECRYLDSTFAGVMVGLALQLKDTGGKITVFGANPRCREELQTLGVAELFTLDDEHESEPRGANHPLPLPYRSEQAWGDTILEAHETLVKADPANLNRLQEVLDYLHQQPTPRR